MGPKGRRQQSGFLDFLGPLGAARETQNQPDQVGDPCSVPQKPPTIAPQGSILTPLSGPGPLCLRGSPTWWPVQPLPLSTTVWMDEGTQNPNPQHRTWGTCEHIVPEWGEGSRSQSHSGGQPSWRREGGSRAWEGCVGLGFQGVPLSWGESWG